MNNIPMSKDSFTAFLHHSYPDFFTNIKDFSMAAETFSISDPYFHEWTVRFHPLKITNLIIF